MIYFLKFNLFFILLFGIYYFLLRELKHFTLNRTFLLIIPLIAVILPGLSFDSELISTGSYHFDMQALIVTGDQITSNSVNWIELI